MTRQQWKNLWRSFRWARRTGSEREALAWIGMYSTTDRRVVQRVIQVTA